VAFLALVHEVLLFEFDIDRGSSSFLFILDLVEATCHGPPKDRGAIVERIVFDNLPHGDQLALLGGLYDGVCRILVFLEFFVDFSGEQVLIVVLILRRLVLVAY